MAQEAKFKRDAMQAEAEMGISARKQERDFMIGQNEVISENMKRAQAESNRNAAITGMFESAGSAITAGADSKLFGGEDSFFGKTKKSTVPVVTTTEVNVKPKATGKYADMVAGLNPYLKSLEEAKSLKGQFSKGYFDYNKGNYGD